MQGKDRGVSPADIAIIGAKMQSGLFRCSAPVVENNPRALQFCSAFADLTNNLEFTGATSTASGAAVAHTATKESG